MSWSKWGWLLHKIYVPTKNTKQQLTANNYLQPAKEQKGKHKRESRTTAWRRMEERLEDGSRWQRGFAIRRSSNTNTEVLKSFRWPHTRVVTTTSYIQMSTTFSRHQSRLPLTFKTFNTFYFRLPTRAHVLTSLHFTLTDWRPLRVAASSHAPCQSRGHVVHDSPRQRGWGLELDHTGKQETHGKCWTKKCQGQDVVKFSADACRWGRCCN